MQKLHGTTYCFNEQESWVLLAALQDQANQLKERANQAWRDGYRGDSERLDRMADKYQALANQIGNGKGE